MTNLVPEVFIAPFPLTPWAVPHASQTQQTPNQTRNEWLISQPVLPSSIISAKTTGLVVSSHSLKSHRLFLLATSYLCAALSTQRHSRCCFVQAVLPFS